MHHAMSCRCDFDHASPDLRTPGHKQSTSKSKLQTQPAAGHVHMTVTASSKSRVQARPYITCRVPSHIWRETSKSPTFHLPPSTFEFESDYSTSCPQSITVVRTHSGSGSASSVPIGYRTHPCCGSRPWPLSHWQRVPGARGLHDAPSTVHGAREDAGPGTRNTHAHTPRALPWACSRVLSTVVSPWIVAVSVPIRRAMINDS